MEFKEIKRSPEFTLKLSLEHSIDLWHIVNEAHKKGNEKAKPFVDVLTEFVSQSNLYTQYLDEPAHKKPTVEELNSLPEGSTWSSDCPICGRYEKHIKLNGNWVCCHCNGLDL